MGKSLRVLIVEVSEDDTLLILHELRHGGYDPSWARVDTAAEMAGTLCRGSWDVIISDYIMPQFSGQAALSLSREKGFDLPFIIVSGNIGEDVALEAMKSGAHDYIMKNNLKRLVPAIERALGEAEQRRARRRAEQDLKKLNETLERRVVERTAQIESANEELRNQINVRKQVEEALFAALEESQQRKAEVSALLESLQKAKADLEIRVAERTAELRQSFQKLRKTLEETVHALSLTVEKRDPYTAGHQKRVARLAGAIGLQMGLPEEQIKGIRVACLLHDIGKIYIPSAILNKPGRINEKELELIKDHPKVGYEILRKIDFTWPVSQIVFQHHEKINGSGYPRRLTGEDILLEARILAVADVVEAMSSHRPYRPSLGIDKALEEIAINRGIFYDPFVVDACLEVVKHKRFDFKIDEQRDSYRI